MSQLLDMIVNIPCLARCTDASAGRLSSKSQKYDEPSTWHRLAPETKYPPDLAGAGETLVYVLAQCYVIPQKIVILI
jgi:hypothetical protein